ncbi:hypothetical protein [Paenibacillus soyae]|uniref:Uncharacterized protein n=1 Tax=Paenibacillus soyae TaxID=2969249 RepID=A0A9X2SDB4_9BACL|nr:hypothetical protein [Paenibacillus soyae]MCR2807713.1 hypothetical protein [Paenibacillus soyae]
MFNSFISRQDTVVTINGTSRVSGGETGDIVNIDTVTTLTQPPGQALTLVLPAITNDPQRAYIRTLDELDNKAVFQSPISTALLDADMDDAQRTALEAAIAANEAQWEQIQVMASSIQVTKIDLGANDQELKFFLHKTLQPDESGIYTISFIAPFSNLTPANGFEMSLVIILPHGARPVGDPEVSNPTGGPLPELRSSGDRVGRHIFEYYMRQDPIFTVRYTY